MTGAALPPREIVLPFGVDSLGRIGFSEDPYRQIASHLQMIVGTQLNERPMTPDYGVDSYAYVFAPNDDATLDRLALEVENAIRDWEPLVTVNGVAATRDLEAGLISVNVTYSLNSAATADTELRSATITLGGTVVESRG